MTSDTMARAAERRAAKDGSGDFVEGLARGLSVLEAFDEAHAEMTLSEVAARAGMSPAAARRSLHTLVRLGYVRKVQRKFVLSVRVLALGSSYLRATSCEELLLPELQRLVAKFGDAASVAALDGTSILYVAHYSEQRASRLIATVGTTYPAYATSLGKVLLAGLEPEQLDACLARMEFRRLTDATVRDKPTLERWIGECRARGYATSADELDYGITSIAVPVRDVHGDVVAAINSSGYSGRVSVQSLTEERLEDLRQSAMVISRLLESHPVLMHSFPSHRDRS